ncbi:MAG: hypothetical protein FRC54_09940 [bacterium LCO1.1]|uniref:Uncharacterized protein n=1 Tax=Candidatus Weimeria bifida TaxID=2599074 RepID=A0A6N7J0Y5_9FIRM|nr:hypothetical protein [Candidatus Weimeria bifida]
MASVDRIWSRCSCVRLEFELPLEELPVELLPLVVVLPFPVVTVLPFVSVLPDVVPVVPLVVLVW